MKIRYPKYFVLENSTKSKIFLFCLIWHLAEINRIFEIFDFMNSFAHIGITLYYSLHDRLHKHKYACTFWLSYLRSFHFIYCKSIFIWHQDNQRHNVLNHRSNEIWMEVTSSTHEKTCSKLVARRVQQIVKWTHSIFHETSFFSWLRHINQYLEILLNQKFQFSYFQRKVE